VIYVSLCVSVCLSVCLCVCHDREQCKNDATDRDAVWWADSRGPKEQLWVVHIGATWRIRYINRRGVSDAAYHYHYCSHLLDVAVPLASSRVVEILILHRCVRVCVCVQRQIENMPDVIAQNILLRMRQQHHQMLQQQISVASDTSASIATTHWMTARHVIAHSPTVVAAYNVEYLISF